jgi:hypothetical protein
VEGAFLRGSLFQHRLGERTSKQWIPFLYHFFAYPDPGSCASCALDPGDGINFFRIPDPAHSNMSSIRQDIRQKLQRIHAPQSVMYPIGYTQCHGYCDHSNLAQLSLHIESKGKATGMSQMEQNWEFKNTFLELYCRPAVRKEYYLLLYSTYVSLISDVEKDVDVSLVNYIMLQ